MPVIRISDSTWARMKAHARPLEDTADDVVRRALDALEGASAPKIVTKTAAPNAAGTEHEKLPQKEFRGPILIALHQLGGRGTKQVVTEAVLPQVEKRLRAADYVMMETGEKRWENAVAWERSDLKKEGYLRSDSPRGIWELSERGKVEAASLIRNRTS